ncbi:MAG: hypothetical protein ACLPX7_20330, partial [Xanthobacteraceae bacterium]
SLPLPIATSLMVDIVNAQTAVTTIVTIYLHSPYPFEISFRDFRYKTNKYLGSWVLLVTFYATAKGDDLLRSCDWHDERLVF